MNISASIRTFLCMLAVLISLPAARVSIEGFAPPEATPGFVLREYQRIYALLAGERDRRVDTITVIFYTHAATGGAYRLPEWGGGGAIGADTIVIPMDANPFLYDSPSRTVIHELAHIVVNRLAPRMRVPRWFHEGVAMMVAGDVTFREQVIVSRAIFTGSLTPLAHIDSVNAFGRSRARLAYSQSRLAVEYLVNAYGVEVLAEILASGNARRGFYKGIHDVLGLRRDEIHGLIEEHIQKRFGPIVWLGDTYLLWLGMFVLFVAGVIATAIRNRGKRLRMEAEEEEEEERAGELHQ